MRWNYYDCMRGRAMRFAMRLMGTNMLEGLAGSAGRGGDVASLRAELEAADWTCRDDAATAYPNARADGGRVRISLGSEFCVDLLVNYGARMVLIEYAGLVADAPRWKAARQRKAA